MRIQRNCAPIVALLVLAGCIDELVPPEFPQPAAIKIVSGDGQIQGRNRLLNEPVIVQAVDESGRPVPGVEVSFWTHPSSGSVNVDRVTTESGGRAAVSWTLGDLVGTQSLVVSGPDREIVVSATARQSDFDVHFVADPGLTAEQVEAIRAGTERWTDVITGELPEADPAADEDRGLPGGGGVPRHGEFVELIYDGSRIVGIVVR